MKGPDVLHVLRSRGITLLHHANTVTTSCTFLQEKGLVSRGYAADRKLPQTSQYTDAKDKAYGVWYDVFVDTVDIHGRASRRNQYGPVLFALEARILDELPLGSEVLVTKKNPTKWIDGEPTGERFFLTAAELAVGLVRGTFDQMILVRTPGQMVPFPKRPVVIQVDNPQRRLSSGEDAHGYARGLGRSR